MQKKRQVKNFWSKFWFLLWKDDSFKGWLFSVVILIIFILFIFFPALRLVTGTSLPLAIVESCSMYHEGNLFSDFDSWWDKHDTKYSRLNINNLDFREFSFKNGFNKGDILFIIGARPEKLEEGDVIIFNAERRNPIIHRIIDIKQENGEYTFSTIGDNNPAQLSFETKIREDELVGKAVIKLAPYLGWIKLIFFEQLRPAQDRGLCSEN